MNTLKRLLVVSFMVVALPSLAADMNFEPKEKAKLPLLNLLRNLGI